MQCSSWFIVAVNNFWCTQFDFFLAVLGSIGLIAPRRALLAFWNESQLRSRIAGSEDHAVRR